MRKWVVQIPKRVFVQSYDDSLYCWGCSTPTKECCFKCLRKAVPEPIHQRIVIAKRVLYMLLMLQKRKDTLFGLFDVYVIAKIFAWFVYIPLHTTCPEIVLPCLHTFHRHCVKSKGTLWYKCPRCWRRCKEHEVQMSQCCLSVIDQIRLIKIIG